MSCRDFALSVTRAETEAADAAEVLDDMVLWVERLQPYFDFDPQLTVAQAVQLYVEDRSSDTSRT